MRLRPMLRLAQRQSTCHRKRSCEAQYYDIGTFGRKISTDSSEAQIWFNRGLTWTYCFNHGEACACFEQVITHDPDCAMGYWGLAFAAGPNYNKTWGVFDEDDIRATVPRCNTLARQALEKSDPASPVEQALIRALQRRYATESVLCDFSALNKDYANAMRIVYDEFGHDDLDVATLFADALMNWKPRQMFHARTGKPILTSPVLEVRTVLERGLQHPEVEKHPGLPHLYIHLMEMSDTPEVALRAGDMIRDSYKDAGHMAHMPTHIDILVGEYRRSMLYNYKATIADDKFYAIEGGKNFYSYYRLHDYHSLVYAAMLAGQQKVALQTIDRLEATITEDMLRHGSMANWLEFFLSVKIHVFIRFGMWDKLKSLELPQDKTLYCVLTVMTHYGRGIAYAAKGDLRNAGEERALFADAATRVPPSRLDFPNRIVDILKVAKEMFDGEMEYRRGRFEVAFRHIRQAIVHEDALRYTEPWGWMLPARHAYGALSLEQGLFEQAADAYAEDLGLKESLTRAHAHPKNVWALHGYHESLQSLKRLDEAHIIHKQLKLAQAEADVQIPSSCFCRVGTPAESSGQCCKKPDSRL
ncbi:hypothetical protein K461DRAFT_288672 [Myriangium duriaei CBS 260.36]|uniref:TPR domain protein n=1 Tax=Myriangium duriaei CBS 260.36 TaxID=1168546 RepID=A0A9P4MCV5_9PEZI|nr:hypothetical protein K461DRAFT_288672 [Myriangium duriaei CBS 260.36]